MLYALIAITLISAATSFAPNLPQTPQSHKYTTRRQHKRRISTPISPLLAGRARTDSTNNDANDDMVEISLSEDNLLSFLNDHDDGGEPDVEDLLAFETAIDVDALSELSDNIASANLLRAISSETLPVDMVVGDKSLPGDLGFDPFGFSKLDPFVVLHKNRLQLIDGTRQVKKR